MCQQPLLYGSDIEQSAARHGLCPACYAYSAEAFIFMQRLAKKSLCEHLWNEWAIVEQQEEEEDLFIFVRKCELCGRIDHRVSELTIEEDPDTDISWCDLDRTTPEP